MEALVFLIPISLVVSILIVLIGFFSIKNGQYDDLDKEANQGLLNEELISKNASSETLK